MKMTSTDRISHRPARFGAALALVACLIVPQTASAAPKSSKGNDIAIAAFKDVCLASAPTFATAAAKAKRYGVKDADQQFGGMTEDGSMSVQVKPKKECAVTSENRSDPTLYAQFLRVIASSGVDAPQGGKSGKPFVATIKGKRFVFQHDRRGGEAYVMISLDN